MRRPLFAVLSASAVLLGALLGPGAVAPAQAGTVSGGCTSSKGVTVIVNFGSLGGGTSVRCYSGATSSTTGLSALSGAGFSTDGTAHDGPGFVCRINGKPSAADEQCIKTPPATAYWSYWYAPNGGSWSYSNKGAESRHVILGGFEGWAFHSGSGDAVPPAGGSPTRPVPPPAGPTPTYSLGPAQSTRGSGSTAGPPKGPSPTSKATASKKATPTATATPTASETATASASEATEDSNAVAGGQLPGDPPSSGQSPVPFVLGAGGVALVLGGAGLVVVRRRKGIGI